MTRLITLLMILTAFISTPAMAQSLRYANGSPSGYTEGWNLHQRHSGIQIRSAAPGASIVLTSRNGTTIYSGPVSAGQTIYFTDVYVTYTGFQPGYGNRNCITFVVF